MSEHLEAVINDVAGQITRYQDLLQALRAFRDGTGVGAQAAAIVPHGTVAAKGKRGRVLNAKPAVAVKRKYTRRPRAGVAETKTGARPGKMAAVGNHSREGNLIVAMRTEAARLKSFTRVALREAVLAANPEMPAKQFYGIGSNLILMLERGELRRTGTGDTAVYTVAALRGNGPTAPAVRRTVPSPPNAPSVPSEKEKAYQELRGGIQVPRDPEVESDRE